MKVLVTGGAGFIGTHLTRRLLQKGCEVSILDNFSPQVHGANDRLQKDIEPHVKLHRGDIRDRALLTSALQGQDAVVHLAAETGTGQSMYTVQHYEEVNVGGTALLLDVLVNGGAKSISRLVVASSRAVYGEGAYKCDKHGNVFPGPRVVSDMKAGKFEPLCPICGSACEVIETSEDAPFAPSSWYGLTKQVQEQMVLMFGRTLGLSAHALRYQNVYGPGQSLKNPYTGILAIFSSQARLNEPIMIFEDGKESRDFVYVEDVADATFQALSVTTPVCRALNVGSGKRVTVLEVVEAITNYFGSSSKVAVNGAFREGDIRHCVADLARIRETLGFSPKWDFVSGLNEFLSWASGEEPSKGSYSASLEEISKRGLLHG